MVEKGHSNPVHMTYKQANEFGGQANEFGGQVRKGEHGNIVVYADRYRKKEATDTGEEVERDIPFLKAYTVFNAGQIDGLPQPYHLKPEKPLAEELRHAAAETFMRNTGAEIRHGGNRAFYTITHDYIQLPPFEAFKDAESYYLTFPGFLDPEGEWSAC
jgi:antirestriction protein ArdC